MFGRRRSIMRLIAQSVIELDDSIRDMEARLHGHIGSLEAQINNPAPPFEPGKLASTAPLPEEVDQDRAHGESPSFPDTPPPVI